MILGSITLLYLSLMPVSSWSKNLL